MVKLNNLKCTRLRLTFQDDNEQRAIAAVLSDMDAEIAALEHRRDKTIAIKQGMMQQLLTGKVRLSESRICADDADDADDADRKAWCLSRFLSESGFTDFHSINIALCWSAGIYPETLFGGT